MNAEPDDFTNSARIRAAQDRLREAQAAAQHAFAAWHVRKDETTTETFRKALEEQSAAALALVEVVKQAHGVADRKQST